MSRVLVPALLVVLALLLQLAVVARLPLPGAAPELLLVVVVALALAAGPRTGALAGFGGGLLADLLSDHRLGRLALVLTVVGYLAGTAGGERSLRTALRPFVVVGASAVGAVLLFAGTGVLVGDPRVTADAVSRALVGPVAYAWVVTPFVVPLVAALVRRTALEPHRRRR